eukprot:960620-Pyramimonas_sp.AAC.1
MPRLPRRAMAAGRAAGPIRGTRIMGVESVRAATAAGVKSVSPIGPRASERTVIGRRVAPSASTPRRMACALRVAAERVSCLP